MNLQRAPTFFLSGCQSLLDPFGSKFADHGSYDCPPFSSHPFQVLWMDQILHHFETMGNLCWYFQGSHHSRVPQAVPKRISSTVG